MPRLVVEVDGASHRSRASRDASRDRKLARLGYRVLRIEAALVMSVSATVGYTAGCTSEPEFPPSHSDFTGMWLTGPTILDQPELPLRQGSPRRSLAAALGASLRSSALRSGSRDPGPPRVAFLSVREDQQVDVHKRVVHRGSTPSAVRWRRQTNPSGVRTNSTTPKSPKTSSKRGPRETPTTRISDHGGSCPNSP